MREVLASLLRPFLPGVEIRPVVDDTDPARGCYLVVVPRSTDAPHAVRRNDALAYPVRNEETTRYLTEGEVAARYRDRFAARVDQLERMDRAHAEGSARLRRRLRVWLAMSAVPSLPGEQVPGRAALATTRQRVQACAASLPREWGLSWFADGSVPAVAGLRRVILSNVQPYAGTSDDAHLELHHDGSGFAALVVGDEDEPQEGVPSQDTAGVYALNLELAAHGLVTVLAAHAAGVGAGGELALRAELLLPLKRRPGVGVSPTAVHAPRQVSGMMLPEAQIPRSLRLTQTAAASTAAALDELALDPRAAVCAAHRLAADVLGEFGVPEPLLLRSDGTVEPRGVARDPEPILTWAQRVGALTSEVPR
jgi:hypothetical protein